MQAFFVSLAAIVAYGVLHSLMASFELKRVTIALIGERAYMGLYRLIFNVVALVAIIPVLLVIWGNRGETIWHVGAPWSYGMMAIQAVGIIGLVISVMQIDGQRFLGLRQMQAWRNGDPLPLPPEPLQLKGVYGLVRHPLYLFSLLAIWPLPVMSASILGFNVGATVYFIVGSLLEEQKLHRAFGDAYEVYRQQVPWMIPFLKWG